MSKFTKTLAAGAATAAASAAIVVGGAAPAQAVPGCSANPVFATAMFSQCAAPDVWHRAMVTCWAWWAPGTWYERYGNPAYGWQQSWTTCDVPFTLRSWHVVP